ncbi:predicted protein [Phaeodactylum tricornutum CCAP 1055/1]|uniref:NADP-dependent oxidoreductase domain-containing protein n=2 Tax=Phaeodactylum tricornutum TaxID=2850 RepID=B7G8M7_PHATC|nr:predicted protein [Phaeodactylum tricornutum CCAP 1055/1]EEC45070.1 predicted protein [Phaeodactylum tricornutum CCAP 1055/1]|eukprot:XP_002183370.1 predicted protein [Phaeodactylum tricornutum CCAP 1055/1]
MSIFQFISRWRALALLVPAIGLGSFLEADALSVRPAANHPEALCGLPSVTLDRRQALVRGTIAATTGLIASGVIPPFVASADAIPPTIAPIATLSDGGAFPLASVLARNQKGFARAVRDSGISRDQLYICGSVVSNRASGYEAARQATSKGWQQNMEKFSYGNIEYLDQIMLDYPGPDCESIQGQWASFESMHAQKLTKSLSVSNFSPAELDCVLQKAKVKPVVNQLPYSVAYHPDRNVIVENKKRGVLVQAWAPLGGSLGGRFSSSMKGTCAQIGKRYGKSFAQVALRWIVQTGGAFTTQSKNKAHFTEDLDIFDFELTEDEMARLTALA